MTEDGKGFRSVELKAFLFPFIARLLNSVTLGLIYACKIR